MSQGILVRVTTNIVGVGGTFATRLWVVAVDDPQVAERAVPSGSGDRGKARVKPQAARDNI